jgi:SOS response regulatory protein OraA/RecX
VPEEDTRAALQSIFGDGGLDVKGYVQDDDQHDGEVGEGDNAVKALLRAARDRYQMTNGLSKETRKRRIFNWLQRRGHRAEDAIKILHLLEREQTDEEGQLT